MELTRENFRAMIYYDFRQCITRITETICDEASGALLQKKVPWRLYVLFCKKFPLDINIHTTFKKVPWRRQGAPGLKHTTDDNVFSLSILCKAVFMISNYPSIG